ncbi:hypothetical protein EJA72_14330 [Pseudomonas sp. PB120]|nr:hypothetical protein [Pseudomonas sp. PB120]
MPASDQTPIKNCGSEPARDDGVSVNESVDCQSAIASRLAPTLVFPHWFCSGLKDQATTT